MRRIRQQRKRTLEDRSFPVFLSGRILVLAVAGERLHQPKFLDVARNGRLRHIKSILPKEPAKQFLLRVDADVSLISSKNFGMPPRFHVSISSPLIFHLTYFIEIVYVLSLIIFAGTLERHRSDGLPVVRHRKRDAPRRRSGKTSLSSSPHRMGLESLASPPKHNGPGQAGNADRSASANMHSMLGSITGPPAESAVGGGARSALEKIRPSAR